MTEQQLKDLGGWELVKTFQHGDYHTNRYRFGCMEIEFTYLGDKLETVDVSLEAFCVPVTLEQTKALVEIFNPVEKPLSSMYVDKGIGK